ncbi:glycoside hydrolase family 10 protein [Carboxylicivirga marina]|uniref:Family 10 glycosylhydrolase n=1 Tax=Carboxylicivirga marina TaxID=2800988 RepID=A0ABS1HRE7_9BACT|nr:family 10 glycosylhydrolase [Carboxylicivirga marina]MBK3519823.1 family 10 glycosylhydrolase [Carboxylicivirga marina]
MNQTLKVRSKFLFLLLFNLYFSAIISSQSKSPKYEMRGVWVATVANIDWPSKPGLKVKEQKKEALEIIQHCKDLGLNTIFLQVRPASDVLYQSSLEPWSKVLTGVAGKNPRYDPLDFWIELAHSNGLELHAWINPYRASMSLDEELPEMHPIHIEPDMFVEYGNKVYYNPGNPKSNIHINKVVKELVQNYAIDGIHMDDYFYPYPIHGQAFPDSLYYHQYGKDKFANLADWRRNNVNETIETLRATIKNSKPWVQFGISPFGVWRNSSDDSRGSETKAGTTNYDGLYADVLLWMKNSWIDYVVPQLYWGTSHPVANYTVLCNWWNQNHYDIPVYIGHGIYKIGSDKPDWQDEKQLPNQIKSVRSSSNLSGSVYFSYKHFKRDLLGFNDELAKTFYSQKAIVPHIGRMKYTNSSEMPMKVKARAKSIRWKGESSSKYIVYLYDVSEAFNPEDPKFIFDLCYSTKYRMPKKKSKLKKEYLVRIAAINAFGSEGVISEPVLIKY